MIYVIERFALHDGPGIRTMVFMKGCPLRCLWCSSPHTQNTDREISHVDQTCTRCGTCAETCPVNAVTISPDGGIAIDRTTCNLCCACIETCPTGSLEILGKEVTPTELLHEVEKDSAFYRRSNGGVTVGGGEPTTQHAFVNEFLSLCKKQYIHTVIETCGYSPWEYLEKLLVNLDLVYMDIKHMDEDEHRHLTGVSNKLILDNARKTAEIRPLTIRVPIVPGYTDSEENILSTSRFAAALGPNFQHIELLSYHRLGIEMYRRLGRQYPLATVLEPDSDHLEHLKRIAESCGVKVQDGG